MPHLFFCLIKNLTETRYTFTASSSLRPPSMATGTLRRCWYNRSITRSQSFMIGLCQSCSNAARNFTNETGSFIHEWTPFLLVMSYFVFSVCLYMFCTKKLIDMFWFLYLTTNFYIAGSTVLEALMSVGPCRDARKAVRKAQERGWVFPTSDHELLFLDLLIVSTSTCACLRDSL